MFQIIGIVLLFGLVFGSFLMSGGNMGVIIEAAPHELMAILGAGVASFLISNSMTTIKATAGGFGKIFKGPNWKASDYTDLLSLLFVLTKTMKTKGVIAVESHIENPHESAIFSRFPKISKDHFAVDFICDTLRMMTMNLEDPHQVEDAMEKQIEKHHHEALSPAGALQSLADALPALGIHGRHHRAARSARRHDRERAGGHLPRRVHGLWLGRADGEPAEGRGRRGKRLLQDHPGDAGGPPARQRRPDFGRDRTGERSLRLTAQFFPIGAGFDQYAGRGRLKYLESFRRA